MELKDKVQTFQRHGHTFSCSKKKKTVTINSKEGYGRLDGTVSGPTLKNLPLCRFKFPRFPLDKTTVVKGINKELDENEIKARKLDLNKIVKFLLRQTYNDDSFDWLKKMDFWQFLYEVGMFKKEKKSNKFSKNEKKEAKQRYLNAIALSVQGSATVVLKRKVKDIFINGYNKHIMRLHKANQDFSICIDHFACAQYICGYLTKNESGISLLLKAINEDTTIIKDVDKINALASILDKNREVSINEAIYRILGLTMTKSSVKVKYLSTVHPHFRDGLLKGNIDELPEGESIFHMTPYEYYECRPEVSNDPKVIYEDEELSVDYWANLSAAEFWSKYEVVYDKKAKEKYEGGDQKKNRIQALKNNKGFIRRRSEMAILRYYLNYNNDEDLASGLLVLFMPFRNEIMDIHQKDVQQLLKEKNDIINEKRAIFERYKVMTDLISDLTSDPNNDDALSANEDDDAFEELESTELDDIEDFTKTAKEKARKDLSSFKSLTDLCHPDKLRESISTLNIQQRKLFDDVVERVVSTDENERPFYLFLTGNAGTGKSFLVRVLIDAIKHISIKAGDELRKPPLIVMAPTAAAACIIGGKTIDSALSFNPSDINRYTQVEASKLATMKFQYEDLQLVICDEVSMVGSSKLTKINFRLQDIADGEKKNQFMGGVSFIATGNNKKLIFIKHN